MIKLRLIPPNRFVDSARSRAYLRLVRAANERKGNSMASALFVIGLVFVIVGSWLLLWRLLHICYLGEFWNNTPQPLSWGATIVFAGVAVIFAGFVTSFQECEFGCARTGAQPGAMWVAGGIVVGVGLAFIWCPCCRGSPDDKPAFSWDAGVDHRGYMSGVDFVAIAIGLAIFSAMDSMGDCPQSCAQAVVQ